MANEVEHLLVLRGEHGVCPLLDVLRSGDSVALVLPFFEFVPFRAYVAHMDVRAIAEYLRALLRAVAHVHAHDIMHRDVKPSNFLRSSDGRRFMLIDFGLAQRVGSDTHAQRTISLEKANAVSLGPANAEAPDDTAADNDSLPARRSPGRRRSLLQPQQSKRVRTIRRAKLTSASAGGRSRSRGLKQAASRAGTRGFRAPEVLWRFEKQTTAIDVWSVGVVMLSLLTRRYPFFHSPDDMTGLAELITIFGFERLRNAAARCDKQLQLDGPDSEQLGKGCSSLRALVQDLCPEMYSQTPSDAYSLLDALLEPAHDDRITASDALQHPFIKKFASSSE